MRIKLTSVLVPDQEHALRFYTEVLGFQKKVDLPVGEFRWLTLVSPEGPEDLELVLEPNQNPAARSYQESLFEQGIPLTAFASNNVAEEFERLKELGVVFRSEPMVLGGTTLVIFEDTCGNLIQIYEG